MEAHHAQVTATRRSGDVGNSAVSETRKLAAILVADIVGYSRLAGADEDRILARLRTLRSDLIDPILAVHHGRVVKRTGDGSIVEFRSVVDAVRCAIEVQSGLAERNAGVPPEKRIEYRVGIHLGDVVEESDGDLMGDGINIAARLEGVAKPGAICLSEQAYWQVKGRLDLKVTDLGATQLKNIAEPIHVYSLEVGQPLQAKPVPSATPVDQAKALASNLRLGSTPLAAAIAAFVLLVAAGGWYTLGNRLTTPAQAAHLSIVVLPFANLSGDLAQDYFADGITENLTTELSRIRNSFVIARNTAFTYKGKSADAKEIGRELGVRYVLEGSVQRNQSRVRVNAQLIDGASGAHLWADRFDEDIADLFKLQDEVVARLANSLSLELMKAEAEKGVRSKNPDVIDLFMRGEALSRTALQQANPKEASDAAKALYEQALAIDPNDSSALAGAGWKYYLDYYFQWGTAATDYDAKVLAQADRAIAIDPNNVNAYALKSFYLNGSGRSNEGFRAADEGLAINPNNASLYNARAYAEINLGRFEQAKADISQAMRLSPRDPLIHLWQTNLADAEMGLGHFDAAIDLIRQAIDAGFRNGYSYKELAAAYALAGKTDDAKQALAEALRYNPKLTVKWVARTNPLPIVLDGLRKAGLPEE
jgi:adenylate cyclase